MQPQCAGASATPALPRPFLGFRHGLHLYAPPSSPPLTAFSRVSCRLSGGGRRPHGGKQKGGREEPTTKKKDNVWSIDNELAAMASSEEKASRPTRRRRGRRPPKVAGRKGSRNSPVLVSSALLIEIQDVLQTQEPVIKPAWDTFSSSVSGVWKGIGAVFSPFTAEMEPVGVGNQNENLYDCYTFSRIEKVPSESPFCQIRRKTNWVPLNPFGETRRHTRGGYRNNDSDGSSVLEKGALNMVDKNLNLPTYESFDFGSGELLEEDSMSMEPGLVFFEDGSYSRGPVHIPVGDFHESKYFLSPTLKFEQCLVKGCHKRLRIVHTIEFNEGGSSIQIVRVAVYEETWVSPVNLYDNNIEKIDAPFDLQPFSQRRRMRPSDLTGSWKVFEVSATPIMSEEMEKEWVYLCMEALKKRRLMVDDTAEDVTVLWLTGGATGYVEVREDGVLCIGVGWYTEQDIHLVMERDYGTNGNLMEVRWKTEVKTRLG